VSDASYESAPISYDYRGIHFGNVFLTGEAAGCASPLTGEGIYQSLVSGEAAARLIINPGEEFKQLHQMLAYNRKHIRIMRFLQWSGFLKGAIYEIILFLLKNKRLRNRVNNFFS
jgi:geranylgeranyl reductase